jgi:hypothetical protein
MKQKNTQTPMFFGQFKKIFVKGFALWLIFSTFAGLSPAQDLPDEIRGYKVQKADVKIKGGNERRDDKDKSEAYVKVGDPSLAETSFSGVTIEISPEIDSLEHSGKVDFLTFHDFKVNGMPIEIKEYNESFEFKKNETIRLPKPIKIFLSTAQTLRGAVNEARDRKEEWDVTGRVFVFGRFKKWGFNFKRVVPIDVNIKIKNPIKKQGGLPDIIPQFD